MNVLIERTHGQRKNRLIQEYIHDPYKIRRKLPEPTVCPNCGAVFKGGRWDWADSHPFDAHEAICQACRRTADRYPAGVLTATGNYVRQHRQEIINLVRNLESAEKGDHPLHRVMSMHEYNGSMTVNTTDIHLPRRIGEALHRAHKGELNIRCEKGQYFVRVHWRRD